MSSKERMNRSSDVVVPEMVLRVLLVEPDDSTRQIITALLRKCSYTVSAVSDGLKAWETLKDKPHSIDLVLTEVELPLISGFALLALVVEQELCKSIPVIMMSSQDSISMVLKCMLKGAADFLIKPVRRNELRNLWQHVWRRQTLTAGQHKSDATSENNSASNRSSDYSTSMQKKKECSEKGSDAQSSCTSPYLEAESAFMQNMQGLSQLKCRSASNLSNSYIEKHGECIDLDKESHMPESETGGSEEDRACVKPMTQDEGVRPESDREIANIHCGIRGCNDEPVEHSSGAIDLIGTFDNRLKSTFGHSNYNNGANKFEFAPQLELSLRRFCPSSLKNHGSEERHTLNHSNASAFSWYNNGRTLQPLFPALAGNCTELKEGTIKSHELLANQHSENTFGTSQPHGAIMSKSQENMTTLVIGQSGQAELALPSPQRGLTSVPGLRFDNISAGCGPVIPPIYHSQSGLPPAWSPKRACHREQSPFPMSTSIHSNAENNDSENGYHWSNETTNHSVDQNMDDQNNMEPVEDLRHNSPAAGHGVVNHSSSSSYGGICGGSEKNATLVAAVEKATAPGNFKDGGIFIHDGFRGMDSYHSSQREAALTKFRLKRKDRCYEKKVRYQSRKRLAEQRPRVKGQFVRQVRGDIPVVNADGWH